MQRKVGTILDENLFKKAKQSALRRHITLNHIFEEALTEYLSRQTGLKQKFSAVEMSFGALQLSPRVVRKIAQEEIYDKAFAYIPSLHRG